MKLLVFLLICIGFVGIGCGNDSGLTAIPDSYWNDWYPTDEQPLDWVEYFDGNEMAAEDYRLDVNTCINECYLDGGEGYFVFNPNEDGLFCSCITFIMEDE